MYAVWGLYHLGSDKFKPTYSQQKKKRNPEKTNKLPKRGKKKTHLFKQRN